MITCGIFFIILVSCPIFTLSQSEPIVKAPIGAILGTIQTSRKGMNFYSFRGVRYAEPPVNNLRFKPPVPIAPWTDTYDATKDGPACMQSWWRVMSEDCLSLNVHTHHINDDQNRPVLVFIHGGEFAAFTGQSHFLGPELLMDHDIVVVTINFRLGAFGFLSTGDEHAPGNYGMKDQVEALKWVQKNIRAFGGDPNKVTIAGHNAGAASVILHMVSPMSKNLFHRAIAMSASALNNWVITENPLLLAQKQADILNCPTENSQVMVDCLRELPAKDIAKIIYSLKEYSDDPYAVFTPVIEFPNDERFLSELPRSLIKEGEFANVPLMIGTTKDELHYKAIDLMYDEQLASELSTNWNEVAPKIFYYEPYDDISEKIRDFYLHSLDGPITNDSVNGLAQLYSDSLSIFGVIRTAQIVSNKSSEPVYLYQYNYERKDVHKNDFVGQGHDLELIFQSEFRPVSNDSLADNLMVDKMTTLWKNFMETGNPTPEPSDILDDVSWMPFLMKSPKYINIKEKLTVEGEYYYYDRISFWEKLFPL